MDIGSVTPETLVRELAENHPPPEEKWLQRDDFDPTYGARELRAAARKGWVELVTDPDPACWRFRLTAKGRAICEATTCSNA